MTTESATLIAASIAATASVAGLAVSLVAQFRAELRVAHRQTLDAYIAELGESLHQIVACADILLKTKSGESREKWKCRGAKASASLKNLRPKVRYPLWGLEEGLRVLSRVPDWADHARVDPVRAKTLIARADKLRRALDDATRRSYRSGRCPSLYERIRVGHHAAQCRKVFTDGKPELSADASNG